MFTPALVPLLREHATVTGHPLSGVSDEALVELLTTVFWASLETYEAERRAIGVAFLGTSDAGVILSEASGSGVVPSYQWRVQRFAEPRPFAVGELVKLAVAGTHRRIYTAVCVGADDRLVIAGLAREGSQSGADPLIKILASRPGSLAVRIGCETLLEYEHGVVLTDDAADVFESGPVRRALDTAAGAAGAAEAVLSDYIDAVRSLVRHMAAHGRGGILIISSEERPRTPGAAYRMASASSLASLLMLARRVDKASRASETPYAELLRAAFQSEIDRVIEEAGALTAIDGAVVMSRDLALMAFGVMLPLGHRAAVELGSRGTRHHAGATYANQHPGSVVFIASEDGHVSCLLKETPGGKVTGIPVVNPSG